MIGKVLLMTKDNRFVPHTMLADQQALIFLELNKGSPCAHKLMDFQVHSYDNRETKAMDKSQMFWAMMLKFANSVHRKVYFTTFEEM